MLPPSASMRYSTARLRVVAGHEPIAATGDKHDAAVGQVVRIDVVPIAGRQLPQTACRRC